jgi:hypothetical protein
MCLPQQIFASHSDNNLFAADYMAMGVLRGSKERRRIYTPTDLILAMVFHTCLAFWKKSLLSLVLREMSVQPQIGVV